MLNEALDYSLSSCSIFCCLFLFYYLFSIAYCLLSINYFFSLLCAPLCL